VTIGYDVPWRRVHELLFAAAAATNHVLQNPPPYVLQTALDDFYVAYELNAYTDQPRMMARIYSALHANIQDSFRDGGVEIMSPHYRATRDGSEATVPAVG
jgi:small-conductance mechanosensitive channel